MGLSLVIGGRILKETVAQRQVMVIRKHTFLDIWQLCFTIECASPNVVFAFQVQMFNEEDPMASASALLKLCKDLNSGGGGAAELQLKINRYVSVE